MPNPLVIVHHPLNEDEVGPNELKLFAGSLAAAVDPKLLMDPKLMVVDNLHTVLCGPPSIRSVTVFAA